MGVRWWRTWNYKILYIFLEKDPELCYISERALAFTILRPLNWGGNNVLFFVKLGKYIMHVCVSCMNVQWDHRILLETEFSDTGIFTENLFLTEDVLLDYLQRFLYVLLFWILKGLRIIGSWFFFFLIEFAICCSSSCSRSSTRREDSGFVCSARGQNNTHCSINAWSGETVFTAKTTLNISHVSVLKVEPHVTYGTLCRHL